MSLPVINTPTYELVVPSTKEQLKYRPFLVKEEKILLIAMEEDDTKHMVGAVRTIVDNCTFKTLKISKMPMFDLEYVFLNIRAKSVGEVVSVKILCDDDKETYVDVDIPLEEIEVKFQKGHTNMIDLTDDIKIEMAYPTFEMLDSFDVDTTQGVFNLIGKCVERVIEGETIHERADFNKKELTDFLDSLNTKQFADIQKFFETMPKLSHEIEFTNPKTKKKHKKILEGLNSFFA
tara:strand:+ start:938 stop:1639 length:702 start_codon:yes stop_codon:yes gene_type:complete